MKKILFMFCALFFFLPLMSFAQAPQEPSSSRFKKEDEIWRIRWFYTSPEGVPELKVTFVKLDEQGNYLAVFKGTPVPFVLKREQNNFTAEMRVGNDVATMNGSISRGIVHGTWSAQSTHRGYIVGNIINVMK